LQQIERIGLQVLQAALDEGGQIRQRIAVSIVGSEPATRFCCNDDIGSAAAPEFTEQALALAVPIHVGRVEEVHAELYGSLERPERFRVVHAAPVSAERPSTKANAGDLQSRFAQHAILHAPQFRHWVRSRQLLDYLFRITVASDNPSSFGVVESATGPRKMQVSKIDEAIRRFNAENARDPNSIVIDGTPRPRELVQ